jgi:predicted RNA-binding protein with EMAP domain
MKEQWKKVKMASQFQLAMAKVKMDMAAAKMKPKYKKVNEFTLDSDAVATFKRLAELKASVKELRAQAKANQKEYDSSIKAHWDKLKEDNGLGGKFYLDAETGVIYQKLRK